MAYDITPPLERIYKGSPGKSATPSSKADFTFNHQLTGEALRDPDLTPICVGFFSSSPR